MQVLVTGGAGYIGSHAVISLREAGHDPIVIDDLSTGRRDLLPRDVPLVVGSVGDRPFVDRVLRDYGVGAVLHFAGSIVVPESVRSPLRYYRNNTANSLSLLEACCEAGVTRFIFSSTAAVYGSPERIPVPESAPTLPINPYGATKLVTEWMLRDAGVAHGPRSVILRYFNVAGADPAGRTGQATPEATHLIKVACEAALGKRPFVAIYGEDYPTPDGTALRDYIHVSDLAHAHVLALEHLAAGGDSLVLNCGYGRGASVREVLAAVARAADTPLPIRSAPLREGDPPALVSDAQLIRRRLGWSPVFDNLDAIVSSALAWERRL